MLIDWLAFTLPGDPTHTLDLVRGYCGQWEPQPHGGNGYHHSARVWETGRVFWSLERADMGVHVRLPSSALECCPYDALDVLLWSQTHHASVTRLDIAADDTDYHLLDLLEIQRKVLCEEFVSSARNVREVRPLRGEGGHTIYFGSRESETYLRIYDKAAEQARRLAGEVNGQILPPIPDYWVRVEMELKGKRADVAAKYVGANLGTWRTEAAGWILKYLDFKDPEIDTNKSRWCTSEWWADFLDRASKAQIHVEKKRKTAEDVKAWVEKQVSPSLFVLTATIGHDELFGIVGEASARLSERQVDMIEEYRQSLEEMER